MSYNLRIYRDGQIQAEWTFADGESLDVNRLATDPRYAIKVEHTTDPPSHADCDHYRDMCLVGGSA